MTENKLTAPRPRVVRWYPIVESLREATGCKFTKVGMAELTVDDMRAVNEQATDSATIQTDYAVERAFVGLDGQHLRGPDKLAAWHGLSPKIRSLVTLAYVRVHFPNEEETKAFFDGVELEVPMD